MFEWLTQIGNALDRAFERRMRRASGIDTPRPALVLDHETVGTADDGDVEIANVARGAAIAPAVPTPLGEPSAAMPVPDPPSLPPAATKARPYLHAPNQATQAPQTAAEEGEIVNLPPGSAATTASGNDDEAEIVNLPPGSS